MSDCPACKSRHALQPLGGKLALAVKVLPTDPGYVMGWVSELDLYRCTSCGIVLALKAGA